MNFSAFLYHFLFTLRKGHTVFFLILFSLLSPEFQFLHQITYQILKVITVIISNFYNIISINMKWSISFTLVQYYHCPNNIYCNLILIFFNISINVTYIQCKCILPQVKINSKVIIFQNKANFCHKSYAQPSSSKTILIWNYYLF